jgi:hypothetical protein
VCCADLLPLATNRGADATTEHALYMRFPYRTSDIIIHHLGVAVRTHALEALSIFSGFSQPFNETPRRWYSDGVRLDDRSSNIDRGKHICLFSTASRPSLGTNQPSTQ